MTTYLAVTSQQMGV